MKLTFIKRLSLTSLVAAVAFPVSATMINFEQLPYARDELAGQESVIATKGYVFTFTPAPDEEYPMVVSFQSVGRSWQFNTGTTALQANGCSALTVLTKENNAPFNLYSMDLAETNGPGELPTSVFFEGTTADGNHVYQEFNLDNKLGFESVDFSAQFHNLTSVSWLQGDCTTIAPMMFDNMFVLPVSGSVAH